MFGGIIEKFGIFSSKIHVNETETILILPKTDGTVKIRLLFLFEHFVKSFIDIS